jgi:hypothetical protein
MLERAGVDLNLNLDSIARAVRRKKFLRRLRRGAGR